jgi:AraC family transcriptional regulator, transcriptional activator of pobA
MAQARRLLVETDLGVEEVGRSVGYDDPGYFVRSFRRIHGVTPRAWRRAGRPDQHHSERKSRPQAQV